MPRKVSDYSQSTIYKICCNDPAVSDVYVGSTTSFSKRKNSHKTSCINARSKQHNTYVYQFIRNNGSWENWNMVEVEAYCASTKRELEARERYWLEQLGATLNKKMPTRTKKQYYDENKEVLNEKKKQYCEKNKEAIKETKKQYYEKNKKAIKETKKQYYDKNKEVLNEKKKQYCEKNKEAIKETKKQYYNKNKESIKQKYRARQFARNLHEFIYS